MTTTVTIHAHCASTKQVRVTVNDSGSKVEEFTIQDGEKTERYAYDNREIVVREEIKTP